jgi:addiction module HigA family antidote
MIHEPLHPGVIIKNVLIDNINLTISKAAEHLGITRTTLSRLLNQHDGLTPEMALRLSTLLNTSVDIWINLQAQYDIWNIQYAKKIVKAIIPLQETDNC